MRATGRTFSRNLLSVLAPVAFGGGCVDPVDPEPGLTITISPVAAVFEDLGETVQLTATVEDQNGQAMPDVAVVWLSSNGTIARVSEDGLVTSGESGIAAVQASVGTLIGRGDHPGRTGPALVFAHLVQGDGWGRLE